MIRYKCSLCGEAMTSPDSMAGHRENCPGCGNAQRVPGTDGSALADLMTQTAATPSQRSKRFSGKLGQLIGAVAQHLNPGEKVREAVLGTYEGKWLGEDVLRTGALIATDRRVVLYGTKLTGYDYESFAYRNISSVEMSKGAMGHAITFFASGNKACLKWIKSGSADGFVSYVRQQMDQGSRPSAVPAPVPVTAQSAGPDIPDQIKQLADLHRSGVLTDEEFQAKKTELLSRL